MVKQIIGVTIWCDAYLIYTSCFMVYGNVEKLLIGCSLVGTMIRIKPLFLIVENRKKAVL